MKTIKFTAVATLLGLMLSASVLANDPELRLAFGNLGYVSTGVANEKVTERESGSGMIGKRRYEITRNRRVPGKPVGYYRFTVTVEEYGSEAAAIIRERRIAAGLADEEDGIPPSEFALRYGFHLGNKVYVVTPGRYELVLDGALGSVTSKLEEWVIDASGSEVIQ